jgi:hypothetical protein
MKREPSDWTGGKLCECGRYLFVKKFKLRTGCQKQKDILFSSDLKSAIARRGVHGDRLKNMRGTVRFGELLGIFGFIWRWRKSRICRCREQLLPGFRGQITAGQVLCYSGVRPLYADGASEAEQATHDYVLKLDAHEDSSALLSIFGGKITTYRSSRPEYSAHLTDQSVEQMARGEDSLSPRRRRSALMGFNQEGKIAGFWALWPAIEGFPSRRDAGRRWRAAPDEGLSQRHLSPSPRPYPPSGASENSTIGNGHGTASS